VNILEVDLDGKGRIQVMPIETVSQSRFEQLPRYQKRRFLPEDVRLMEAETVRSFFEKLMERAIHSSEELEQWILDRSELEAILNQEGTILYIRMTCQTDDKALAKAYADFVETVTPVAKVFENDLNKKYVSVMERFGLDSRRYGVYTKGIQIDVELFAQENISLEVHGELLSQEYQTICGAMMVPCGGQEYTLPQMGKFLLDPDRHLREDAWRASARRRLQDKERLESLFDRMTALRNQMAHHAGYDGFCEYKFRALHRFDYTPDDCKKYHEAVEEEVVPLWKKILERRRRLLQLEKLRPWDMAVDLWGGPALKPFQEAADLIQGCGTIFRQLDTELGRQFAQIARMGLLDLESRKGKAPGGYQSTLHEARQPFIFMNAVGLDSDVYTLLHEAGHAFHVMACAGDPLLSYRHGPMEFNEVASMAMELLAGQYLSVFYNADDLKRSRWDHMEDAIFTLVWVAAIDAFQHWIYEHPGHSHQERQDAWVKTYRCFGGEFIDWSGLEEELGFLWHRQLHIFEAPFYYIEYGIAQLGALQIWFNARRDQETTLARYKKALSLGGSRLLPELYETAGIRFDFSREIIVPLRETIKEDLDL
jgi:oligoendopeptidase F